MEKIDSDGQFKADISAEEVSKVMETDEEFIKKVSNDFVVKEGIEGYTLFTELNNRWRNGEEGTYCFEALWKKWVNKWRPYLDNKRAIDLAGEITEKACNRYYKRYKKEVL